MNAERFALEKIGGERALSHLGALRALHAEVYAEPPDKWGDEHASLFAERRALAAGRVRRVRGIVAAADDEATARAGSRRLRRYYRGTRCHRVPSVAVRGNTDGAHRPFPGTNPVRHASVDTATPRSAALQGDTWRDREETARIAENPQLGAC